MIEIDHTTSIEDVAQEAAELMRRAEAGERLGPLPDIVSSGTTNAAFSIMLIGDGRLRVDLDLGDAEFIIRLQPDALYRLACMAVQMLGVQAALTEVRNVRNRAVARGNVA